MLTQDDNPALWLSFSGEDGSDIRNLTQRVSDYFGCPVFVLIKQSEPLCLVTGPATSTSLVPEQQEDCDLCGTNVSLDDLAPLFPDCNGHARYCWNCLAKSWFGYRAKPIFELNVPFKCPNPACTGNVPMWAIRKCVGENDFRR